MEVKYRLWLKVNIFNLLKLLEVEIKHNNKIKAKMVKIAMHNKGHKAKAKTHKNNKLRKHKITNRSLQMQRLLCTPCHRRFSRQRHPKNQTRERS